jgi:hypothetical protein
VKKGKLLACANEIYKYVFDEISFSIDHIKLLLNFRPSTPKAEREVLIRNQMLSRPCKSQMRKAKVFWWSAFSSKHLFIEAAFHRMAFSSSFQNCKQNFCSTSTSKVNDDLVGVTL